MKKLIVDCSKPIGEQEIVVDMTPEEISKALEQSSLVASQDPPPPTLEERIAQLEAALALK